VSVLSFLIARCVSPVPPDVKACADEGKIFPNRHDRNLRSRFTTREFLDIQSPVINLYASISELFEMVKSGNKNVFAVVDDSGILKAIVTLDDIRPYLVNKHNIEIKISQIMKQPPAIIHLEDQPLDILQM